MAALGPPHIGPQRRCVACKTTTSSSGPTPAPEVRMGVAVPLAAPLQRLQVVPAAVFFRLAAASRERRHCRASSLRTVEPTSMPVRWALDRIRLNFSSPRSACCRHHPRLWRARTGPMSALEGSTAACLRLPKDPWRLPALPSEPIDPLRGGWPEPKDPRRGGGDAPAATPVNLNPTGFRST